MRQEAWRNETEAYLGNKEQGTDEEKPGWENVESGDNDTLELTDELGNTGIQDPWKEISDEERIGEDMEKPDDKEKS